MQHNPDIEPSPSGYLQIPPDICANWGRLLANDPAFKVGLVWAGNRAFAYDAIRSIPVETFAPLTGISGFSFYSLQKGDDCEVGHIISRMNDQLISFCADYLDTAGFIDALDLIIAVDTSVAHLAGAMGKQVWLLNRYGSEWRWLLERQDSVWYPSMQIFRQQCVGDWKGVISRIHEELINLL
jgi:hypothetical protein